MKILTQHLNVDVNEGWGIDRWTTNFNEKQQFSYDVNSTRFNGSLVAERSKITSRSISLIPS